MPGKAPAVASARGLTRMTAFRAGPFLSYASIRSRCISTKPRAVSLPSFILPWMSAILASSKAKFPACAAELVARVEPGQAAHRLTEIDPQGVNAHPIPPLAVSKPGEAGGDELQRNRAQAAGWRNWEVRALKRSEGFFYPKPAAAPRGGRQLSIRM